jgi:hypothetical protein
VDLGGVGHVAQRAGEHERAHDEMVGQRDVRRRARDHVLHRGDVGIDVARDLRVGAVREGACLHALVAVGHVDRQQVADVRPPDRHADRLAQHLDPVATVDPGAHRVDEGQLVGAALLAQEVDDDAASRERGAHARVVDVRAGPAQQVAVEDEHPHASGESSRRAAPLE